MGSSPLVKTIGMFAVAAFAASAAGGATATNHRDPSTHELACERRQTIPLTFRPAVFDPEIAVFDVTGLAKALAERDNDMSDCRGGSAVEEPDDG